MTYYQNMQAMQAKRYLHKFDEIVKTMRTKMEKSQRTTNISLDFISEMILHHEGAIEMCKNLLQYKIDPRLRKIAEKHQNNSIAKLLADTLAEIHYGPF